MIIGAALVAVVGLFAICIRTWTEFGQRARKLQAEITHNKRLIDGHTDKLTAARTKIDQIKNDTEGYLRKRSKLEAEVMQLREEVSQREQRLERTRPKSRRVDKADKDELFE
jgi:peptidoglycan hydrolase CwlO-like protein